MAWLYLLLAGLCEVAWIFTLKLNNGFTKLVPGIIALVFILAGPLFVSLAMKTLGMGTSYAVWVGVNCILMLLLGVFYFNEPVSLAKIACVGLIVTGAVGLKLIEAGILKA
jgi:quaternary ammonium compound-resistance protein SugE